MGNKEQSVSYQPVKCTLVDFRGNDLFQTKFDGFQPGKARSGRIVGVG
jgi:hypothetical protein